ncbi:MAG: hypothetical protein KAG14_02010, partial [Mycoplasmataceae bacterium]|nr:hypothetical protein [Mycoplasmataceae bacterium]
NTVFSSISNSPYLIALITSSLFIYLLSMSHSYIGYKMGIFDRKMVSISSFFGGAGIHLFFLKKKKTKNKSLWKSIVLISTVAVVFVAQTSLLAVYAFSNSLESVYEFEKISYSTVAGKENLIEIFSDGLDRKNNKERFINNKNFKDFVYFDKFMQAGPLTDISVPMTWGGGLINTIPYQQDYQITLKLVISLQAKYIQHIFMNHL